MKLKFASLLALLLALAFVSAGIGYAAAKDCTKVEAAQDLAAEKKVEVKGKVEEEKGKATTEMKELKPEGIPEEAPAAPELTE